MDISMELAKKVLAQCYFKMRNLVFSQSSQTLFYFRVHAKGQCIIVEKSKCPNSKAARARL